MIEIGVFHNGASDLPTIIGPAGPWQIQIWLGLRTAQRDYDGRYIVPHMLRFERFANAGHGVLRDDPERALQVIREFISS